jgi:CBS domain-containing protein
MDAMKNLPYEIGDENKRAVVQTARSILDAKGHDVSCVGPHATVYDALVEMARKEIGALLVVSDFQVLGIVSERDYARKVVLKGKTSKDTLISEIMTPSPITVTPDCTVDECMHIVTARRIRHLPVVEDGKLQGIVSIGDLIKAIISAQAYTIDQLHHYIEAEYPS